VVQAYHSSRFDHWGWGGPTVGIRGTNSLHELRRLGVEYDRVEPCDADARLSDLRLVHSTEHIDRVARGESGEWDGVRPEQGALAHLMFGATLRAARDIARGATDLAWVPFGAKHHAGGRGTEPGWESSGFCVFADFAAAALVFEAAGENVLIIDWDVHHGDGTQFTLQRVTAKRDRPHAITVASIHQAGIFPGTGHRDEPSTTLEGVINRPLAAGAGDDELLDAVASIAAACDQPTVVMIATGADGHRDDPLGGLRYSYDGFLEAGRLVGSMYPNARFLIGGAGGYLPHDVTPRSYAASVAGVVAGWSARRSDRAMASARLR
jgi:acetoin utilization deacetylase AcuC-like enzyme